MKFQFVFLLILGQVFRATSTHIDCVGNGEPASYRYRVTTCKWLISSIQNDLVRLTENLGLYNLTIIPYLTKNGKPMAQDTHETLHSLLLVL